MKKTISLFLLLLPIAISSCKKEGCTDESAINYSSKAKVDNGTCEYAQDPCSQNSFKVIKLGTGYLETDVSQDRVSMLFQVLDQNNKGVDNMTNINRYSLIDYDQEMTTNVEADVTISSFGTIPTQIYTAIVFCRM